MSAEAAETVAVEVEEVTKAGCEEVGGKPEQGRRHVKCSIGESSRWANEGGGEPQRPKRAQCSPRTPRRGWRVPEAEVRALHTTDAEEGGGESQRPRRANCSPRTPKEGRMIDRAFAT